MANEPTQGGIQKAPEASIDLSSEMQLSSSFNLDTALQNNLVGYKEQGVLHTGTLRKVEGSVTSNGGNIYSVNDKGTTLQFDAYGRCLTVGHEGTQLLNVSAELPSFSTDHVQTRSGQKTAVINAVRPIDEFAISVISAILEHLQNPQEMSDADILKWCNVAYRWAQGMFSIASTYRTANDGDVNANSDSLKGAIENITKALNTTNSNAASIKAAVENVSTAISSKPSSSASDTVTVKLPDTVKIDNPTNDKFEVEGGGGGISYDGLNDVGDKFSSIPVFNEKAIGRTTLANFVKKALDYDTTLSWLRKVDATTLWTTYADSIHKVILSDVNSDIDTKLKQFATDYSLTKK